MSDTTNRRQIWEEIQNRIRPVLMADWDPIGVSEIPEAADEYDSYIGGIYVLLRDGASDDQIAQHLTEIETKTMGLPAGGQDRYGALIRRLRSLDLPRFVYSV